MKKTLFFSLGIVTVAALASCDNDTVEVNENVDSLTTTTTTTETTTTYTDLATGETVEITRDEMGRNAVNKSTGQPIKFYIDNNTRDTIYGLTGTVSNYVMMRDPQGVYTIDESRVKWDGDDFKVLGDDGSKMKVDGDEVKIKGADGSKTKVDGDESKYKDGDVKIKRDGDELKIKTADGKIKMEDGEPTKVK